MNKYMQKRSHKTGLPPGTLIHIGRKQSHKTKTTVMLYDEEHFEEREVSEVEECSSIKENGKVTWLNVDSLSQVEALEKIGNCFDLHPLVMEDILNTEQRPKMEDYNDYLYIVVKMFFYEEKTREIITEQISLVVGKDFVLSFQEKEGDVFESIRERIKNNKGRVRKMGADYLAYLLLDTIVDNYFVIMEKLGDGLEIIEEQLISRSSPEILREIYELKREMIFLRKSIWPLREVISGLQRSDSYLITDNTKVHLGDVHDHAIYAIDTVETFRDILSGMLDIYLSSISNRTNGVMKVLTVIATIFMPLTFIAGVYGMNFKYMPELNWEWGYPAIWLVMLTIALVMLAYFKKKKWL